MKNILVVNYPENPQKHANLELMLRAQLLNSERLGWFSSDVIVITNKHHGLKWGEEVNCDLNNTCLTGSKVFGLQFLLDRTNLDEVFWLHDLDAWQNVAFEAPEFKDAGFATYSRPRINGGSQFWKRSGKDILDEICRRIVKSSATKEEPTIQGICRNNERVTILNNSFNVGCSGFVERFERAEKPIKVCHLHPNNRIAWQTHRLDRNGFGYVSISKGLEEVLRSFFNLPIELDEEGSRARKAKILSRIN